MAIDRTAASVEELLVAAKAGQLPVLKDSAADIACHNLARTGRLRRVWEGKQALWRPA